MCVIYCLCFHTTCAYYMYLLDYADDLEGIQNTTEENTLVICVYVHVYACVNECTYIQIVSCDLSTHDVGVVQF